MTIDSTAARWAPWDPVWRREGHHALLLAACTNVLVARFTVATRYWHDLALAGGSLLNAFSGGKGLDLNLHHEGGPLANLFTDLSLGKGNRPWASPGGGPAGPRATFYNLRVAAPDAQLPEKVAAPAAGGDQGLSWLSCWQSAAGTARRASAGGGPPSPRDCAPLQTDAFLLPPFPPTLQAAAWWRAG